MQSIHGSLGLAVVVALLVVPVAGAANDPDRAWIEELLQKRTDLDPQQLEEAVRARTNDRYSVPLFCMRQAMRLNPLDSRYPFLMGCTLLHMGQGDQALKFIDEAVTGAPTSVDPLNLKAEYLRGLGDVDGYIATLRQSLAIDDGQDKVQVHLAKALLQRNHSGDEREALDHALKGAGDSEAMARHLASMFDRREYRARMLDRAAEIRTDRAIAALRTDQGGTSFAGRLGSGTGAAVAPAGSSGQGTVTRVGGPQGQTGSTGDGAPGGGSAHTLKDEFYVIKAGDYPRYERLRAIREARRTAASGTSN